MKFTRRQLIDGLKKAISEQKRRPKDFEGFTPEKPKDFIDYVLYCANPAKKEHWAKLDLRKPSFFWFIFFCVMSMYGMLRCLILLFKWIYY